MVIDTLSKYNLSSLVELLITHLTSTVVGSDVKVWDNVYWVKSVEEGTVTLWELPSITNCILVLAVARFKQSALIVIVFPFKDSSAITYFVE